MPSSRRTSWRCAPTWTRLKDEFISTVSHELRTPLTSIRGALGLLSAGLLGNVDPKAQNLLRIASSNTERLIRLINDILDLERMESGRAPLNLRRCSMYDLAREAVDTMTAMADTADGAAGADLQRAAGCDLLRCGLRPDPAGADQSAVECDQVFAGGFGGCGGDRCTCGLAAAEGGGPWAGHSGGQAGDDLRPLPAGGVGGCEQERRHGAGAGDLPQHHSAARRRDLGGAQPGCGPGTTLWVQFTRSARASDSVRGRVAAPIPVPLPSMRARRGGRLRCATAMRRGAAAPAA